MVILVCLVIAAAFGILTYLIALMLPALFSFAAVLGLVGFIIAFLVQLNRRSYHRY